MPSTKSFQNFAKTSLQKSPICYSFIINRGNKSVENPLLGKTSSWRFVKSFMTCMNQMTDEQRTVFTRHELFPAIAWTKRLNQCSVEGICVMIEVLSLFTVSPLLLCATTQCMRTVSHKSLLHKLSSTNPPPVLELLSQIKTIWSQFLPFSVKKERDLATLHSPCHTGLPQVRVVKMSSCPQF